MEQFCIKQIVIKISKAASRFIDTLEEVYQAAGMRLTLQSKSFLTAEEYVHKMLMTMVSPVTLKIEYDLSLFPYIIKPAVPIHQRKPPSEDSDDEMAKIIQKRQQEQGFSQLKSQPRLPKRYKGDKNSPNYEAIPASTK